MHTNRRLWAVLRSLFLLFAAAFSAGATHARPVEVAAEEREEESDDDGDPPD